LDASERRGQVMPAKRTSRLIEPNVPGTSGTSRQRSPDHAQPHPASSTKISKTPGSSGSAGDGGVWPLVWAIRARRLARSIAVAPASWATGRWSGLSNVIKPGAAGHARLGKEWKRHRVHNHLPRGAAIRQRRGRGPVSSLPPRFIDLSAQLLFESNSTVKKDRIPVGKMSRIWVTVNTRSASSGVAECGRRSGDADSP
jgi:hypothetical protein